MPEPAHVVAGAERRNRAERPLDGEDHPWPLGDLAEGRPQQWHERRRRLDEAGDLVAEVAGVERAGIAGKRVVAAGLHGRRPRVRPAVGEAGAVAGGENVLGDQRPWPLGQEPVPHRRQLLARELDQHRRLLFRLAGRPR